MKYALTAPPQRKPDKLLIIFAAIAAVEAIVWAIAFTS